VDPGAEATLRYEIRRPAERLLHPLGRELDTVLGEFLRELEARGLFETGYFVFTSDHGESFGEHDSLFHFRAPFEELARVPLLIRGRGLPGRLVEEPVSLVDLAPTLVELAGLRPASDWPGRSLLASGPQRVLFAFEHSTGPEDSVFMLAGERKVFLTGSSGRWDRVSQAFDLAGDPAEQHDLATTEAGWPFALHENARGQLLQALRPLYDEEFAEPDAAKDAELRALGY
jgi:choline-sulfatase